MHEIKTNIKICYIRAIIFWPINWKFNNKDLKTPNFDLKNQSFNIFDQLNQKCDQFWA